LNENTAPNILLRFKFFFKKPREPFEMKLFLRNFFYTIFYNERFLGKINENTFKLQEWKARGISYIIYGKINITDDNVLINVKITPGSITRFLLIVCLGSFLFFFIKTIIELILNTGEKTIPLALIGVFTGFVLVYVLVTLDIKYEGKKIKEYFKHLFKAEIEGNKKT
jgi:hypothetical protein